jgi:hypothetical protein
LALWNEGRRKLAVAGTVWFALHRAGWFACEKKKGSRADYPAKPPGLRPTKATRSRLVAPGVRNGTPAVTTMR